MADQDPVDDEKKPHDEQAEEDAALGGGHDEHAESPESTEAAAEEAPRKRPGGRPPKSRASQRRAPPEGSVAKSLMLFVLIVGGLVVAFVFLGQGGGDNGGNVPVPSPKWTPGQTVDLELTLVASDVKDLACASPKAFDGKHCQFETPSKPTAPPITDDKKMFKPYTTTDRIQVIGAGLWSDPAMAPAKLPNARFSVKCKFKVDGKMENPGIRWNGDGPWFPQQNEWFAGSFSNCNVIPPT